MMKSIIVAGLIFSFAAVPSARAQVTLDVAKITCDQYTGYKITNPQNIAIWLSGYYSGKRDSTIVETQTLVANAKKLRDYCIRNPQTPIMRAVETLFDKDKK
jgi:acid stress chaperone HdeB